MHDSPRAAADDAERLRVSHGFLVLAVLTFFLIVVGALVRAHDAGLACPDWPLCHGQVVPPFDLKVAFEWGHRVFAGSISLGLLALSWLGWRSEALRAQLRTRLVFGWVLLLTQVVFGGLTVLLLLAPWTVSVHLILGNLFCLTLLWIGLDLREQGGADATTAVRDRTALPPSVPMLVAVSAVALFLQIVLGGWVSSHYAGLACTSFPTCDGESIVPTLTGPVGMHVLHRLNGFVLLGAVSAVAWLARGTGRTGRLAALAAVLLFVQIVVGVVNVLLMLPISLTGLHTALAAGIVLSTGMLVREVLAARTSAPEAVMTSRVAEAR